MPPEICPLLGTLDSANNPCPAVAFPSFENKCLVADDRDTLLLSDQATYCLSGGHRLCPRFRAASSVARDGRVDRESASELAAGILASDQLHPEFMAVTSEDDARTPTRWTWLGVSAVFVLMLLCGASFAAYSGWNQVQAYLNQRESGQVQSIASADPTATVGYIVQTATPAQPAPMQPPPASTPALVVVAPVTGQPLGSFPAAVTATPGGPGDAGAVAGEAPVPVIVVRPQEGASAAPQATTDSPNLLLEVPTRRPTPVFDIPTSTAVAATPTETPTETPTAAPTQQPTPAGTPVVVFGPAQQLVPRDGCTMIAWNVQNVREVYYENIGVDGRGQEEECVDDLLEVYHLVVVLPDGSTRLYTTTVTMLQPTYTPEPTPTFTLEPVFTPTWTPPPPTPTTPPFVRYGVALNVNGSTEQTCAKGATCEIGLIAVNTGEEIDTLLASIARSGPWSAQLCRQDGVCAGNNLALPSVGSNNSANISLRISIPGDAAPQAADYGVEAVSAGSGNVVSSGVTRLRIVVP